MQDIAGCRVVVSGIVEQEQFIEKLKHSFPNATVIDRRQQPSHGYRAVHVIVHISDKPIEVQVRTLLQHSWAEVSEKAADMIDPEIKYGGGPQSLRKKLQAITDLVSPHEELNSRFLKSKQDTLHFYKNFVIIKNELAELAEPSDLANQEGIRDRIGLLESRWKSLHQKDLEMQRNLEQSSIEITQMMARLHTSLLKFGRQKP